MAIEVEYHVLNLGRTSRVAAGPQGARDERLVTIMASAVSQIAAAREPRRALRFVLVLLQKSLAGLRGRSAMKFRSTRRTAGAGSRIVRRCRPRRTPRSIATTA